MTWVNSIALNLYRNHAKRDLRLEELRELPIRSDPNVASIDVGRMLATCNPSDRSLLRTRYLEERDIAEIATACGCSQTAVRIRLLRARRRLRERVERR
ncbi:MAG: hypothetical protein IPM24_01900 [Bryobacterales bacterium]|nr:hypothetical protein [Bryobacterales bacterium]